MSEETPRPPRASDAVLDHVEGQLDSGGLVIGDRLPGERTLSTELGVSRASVREGIRVLDAMGIVRTHVGSGPDAGAAIVSDPEAGLGRAFRLHLLARTFRVSEVIEFRVLIESWAAAHAAGLPPHVKAEPLAGAAAVLERMETEDLTVAEFHELDADFHAILVRMGGNVVIDTILGVLRATVLDYVLGSIGEREAWLPIAARLCGQHREILERIDRGDATGASRAVTEHIRWFAEATTGTP